MDLVFSQIKPRRNKEILDKVQRVAVHASDLDGIASAALLLLMKPNLKVDFLSVTDAKKAPQVYDLVVDLPKIGSAINIDHHKTNYNNLVQSGLLGPEDFVDPNAPSATVLLAEYFGLSDIPHVRKIVEMANLSDTGRYNELLYIVDKIIKCNSRDQDALLRIAWAVAKFADKLMEDPWLKQEYERLAPVISKCKRIASKIVGEFLGKKKIEYLITIVENGVPRICLGDLMYNYIKGGGKVIILINKMQEKDEYCPSLVDSFKKPSVRISIRVSGVEFDAGSFLESFGGGGHKVAAGAKIDPEALGSFIYGAVSALEKITDKIGFLLVNSVYVEDA